MSDESGAPEFSLDAAREAVAGGDDGGTEIVGREEEQDLDGDGGDDQRVSDSSDSGPDGRDGDSGADSQPADDQQQQPRSISFEEHQNLQAALREARGETRELRAFVQQLALKDQKPEAKPEPKRHFADMPELPTEADMEADPLTALRQMAQFQKYLQNQMVTRAEQRAQETQEQAQRREQQQRQQQAVQAYTGHLAKLEETTRAQNPNYDAAVDFVLDSEAQQLAVTTGMSLDQAKRVAIQRAQKTAFDLMSRQQDPTHAMLKLAEMRGFQPGSAPGGEQNDVGNKEIQRLRAGQAASKGLGAASGGSVKRSTPSLEAIAKARGPALKKTIEAYKAAAKAASR